MEEVIIGAFIVLLCLAIQRSAGDSHCGRCGASLSHIPGEHIVCPNCGAKVSREPHSGD